VAASSSSFSLAPLVYLRCRIGGKLTLDNLAETEVGVGLHIPGAPQGWLIVEDDVLTADDSGAG
jgi:hypothetical protein